MKVFWRENNKSAETNVNDRHRLNTKALSCLFLAMKETTSNIFLTRKNQNRYLWLF
jgi:hypothetical protein